MKFQKKGYLSSNVKKLDSKRNFLTFQSVQAHRCKNPKNIIIGRLNVNSLRNKLVAVDELRKNKIDTCLISETKADESFLNQQFKLNGYKMFRKDRHRFGGGLIFFVNEQIPIKILSLEAIPMDIELLLLEFTVKNQRCLCVGIYRPPSQNQKYFIDHLSKKLSQLSCQYDKTMLIGGFNSTINKKSLENVRTIFDLKCLIKKPTWYQSSNPTCIDLILTNKKESFKNTDVTGVVISDHHSLIVTDLKSLLIGNAKTKLYQDYNSFNIDHFKEDLDNNLKNNSITEYSHFQNIFLEILHKHAPIKRKILRFNDNPFLIKALRKHVTTGQN